MSTSGGVQAPANQIEAGSFGVKGDGVTDNFNTLTTAVNEAAALPAQLVLPPGVIVLSKAVKTPLQSGGWFEMLGEGRQSTTLQASANGDLFYLQMNGRIRDVMFDHNGGTGNGLFFRAEYQNQLQTTGTAYGTAGQTGTGGQLCISLTAAPSAAVIAQLAAGPNQIAVSGPGSGPQSAPAYVGTTISYSATGGPGGVPCVFINANTAFPTGLAVTILNTNAQSWCIGTALTEITEMSADRVGFKNRPVSSGSGTYSFQVSDPSFQYPFQIEKLRIDDVFITNDSGTLQPALSVVGARSCHYGNILLDNSTSAGAPRGFLGLFAYDYLHVSDARAIYGVNGNTSQSIGISVNNGGAGIVDAEGIEIINLASSQAAIKETIINANVLRARAWHFPVNASGLAAQVGLSQFSSGNVDAEFTDCDLPAGFNIHAPLVRLATKGGNIGNATGNGVFTLSQGAAVDSGPIYTDNTVINTGAAGTIFDTGTPTATFECHMTGGKVVGTGGITFTDGKMDNGSSVRGVEGLNPVGATALVAAQAFALPTSTNPWVNNSATDVVLTIATGALTGATIDGVAQPLTGTWLVPIGSTFTPTYTAVTMTARYL